MAASTALNELRFLVSDLVPSSLASSGARETFASHLRWPFSMSPNEASTALAMALTFSKRALASEAECRSGSVTTSTRGVPVLFQSTRDLPFWWVSLPASDSMWARLILMVLGSEFSGWISTWPFWAMGKWS